MEPEDFERSFGFLVGDVGRLLRKRFDRKARHLGLTRAQWRVLAQLLRRDGLSQSALAELLDVEPITLTRHVERLEQEGWIERRGDPRDRRLKRVYLAARTAPVVEEMLAIGLATREEALAGLNEAQRESLVDSLTAVKANLAANGNRRTEHD